MKVLLLISIFILVDFVAYSQQSDDNWEFIGAKRQGQPYFISKDYHIKTREGIKCWIKTLKKDEKIGDIIYSNVVMKIYYLFDCANNRVKTLSVIRYTLDGETIDNATWEDDEQKWTEIVPESAGALLILKVCERYN